MHRSACRSLAVLAVLLLSASVVHAQITAATLSGTVKDDTGGVLPGADIVAKNVDTGISRSIVSNGDGAFALAGSASAVDDQIVPLSEILSRKIDNFFSSSFRLVLKR